MTNWKNYLVAAIAVLAIACSMPVLVATQDQAVILSGPELVAAPKLSKPSAAVKLDEKTLPLIFAT